MTYNFTKLCCLFIGGAFLLVAIGCHKHNDVVAPPTTTPPANGGKDTITLGATISLSAATATTTGSTYAWTVNGAGASTDSTFAFTPTVRGDYAVVYAVTNKGGTSQQHFNIHVFGKYENGFFIANEGSYGNGSGTLSFFRYDTQGLEDSVYTKVNPGADFGPNTTELEFGTVYNNKVYLLVKGGGPLVQADAYSLKETGRIPTAAANDFRALLPIDTTKALVSTGNGIYPLNLQTVTLGAEIPGITGEVQDMVSAGNYIFVLSANDGLDILNASDFSLKKTIPSLQVGFAKAMDGSIWAAGGANDSMLVKIDPSTLDTTNVALPFEVNGTFGFWHAGSIAASTKENSIYLGYNTAYTGAMVIYKYVIGTPSSVNTPFINIASGKETYGAGIAYNPGEDQLVITAVQSGYGANYAVNDLDFYSPATGALITDQNYSGYYFPAIPFFHQ
jgi:Domain of unknown function (DUF5074)